MQKWEYMMVIYWEGRVRYINDQEVKNWKASTEMVTHLNQIGEQGWEMVHINWTDYYNAKVIFKQLIM
jgi:hypothetical protein